MIHDQHPLEDQEAAEEAVEESADPDDQTQTEADHNDKPHQTTPPTVQKKLAVTPKNDSTPTPSTPTASAQPATTKTSTATNDDDTTAQRTAATSFSANINAPAAPLHPPTATATVTNVSPVQVVEVRPIRTLVLGVLGLFGYTPGTPTPNPLLDAAWGLYRRIESVFANARPTVGAATVADPTITNGQVIVTGTVDFDDEDGDPLHYTSTDGAHGAVTVDADGGYTYTPTDPSYTGTDTFTITAADTGAHLHGLFGFLSPGGGHTRTATVLLTLTAADNDAPVIENVNSDPGTGRPD
jgi:VCBS repeat-containing protein